MMTAKEAWEATESVNVSKHELRNIELLIEKAIENGYYSCSVYTCGCTLNEKTVSTLIKLGYVIEEKEAVGKQIKYVIKWSYLDKNEEEE